MNGAGLVEKAELDRAQRVLRQLADDLKNVSPALSLRAGALAREAELRAQLLVLK